MNNHLSETQNQSRAFHNFRITVTLKYIKNFFRVIDTFFAKATLQGFFFKVVLDLSSGRPFADSDQYSFQILIFQCWDPGWVVSDIFIHTLACTIFWVKNIEFPSIFFFFLGGGVI